MSLSDLLLRLAAAKLACACLAVAQQAIRVGNRLNAYAGRLRA